MRRAFAIVSGTFLGLTPAYENGVVEPQPTQNTQPFGQTPNSQPIPSQDLAVTPATQESITDTQTRIAKEQLSSAKINALNHRRLLQVSFTGALVLGKRILPPHQPNRYTNGSGRINSRGDRLSLKNRKGRQF